MFKTERKRASIMKKVSLTPAQGKLLCYPVTASMVTCADDDEQNIIAITFIAPVTTDPNCVMISVSPKRYSYDMIKNSGEFVVNIPGPELLYETQFTGRKSGRDVDKFKETGLTAVPAQAVKAPLIDECWGHVECKVIKTVDVGVHTLFIGEIVAASVTEGYFDNGIVLGEDKARLIQFLGGMKYGILDHGTKAPLTKDQV